MAVGLSLRRNLGALAGHGASIAMTAALVATGLGWGAAESDPLGAIFADGGDGHAVYGASLLALWLACGRPRGSKTDFLILLSRPWARVTMPRSSAISRWSSRGDNPNLGRYGKSPQRQRPPEPARLR